MKNAIKTISFWLGMLAAIVVAVTAIQAHFDSRYVSASDGRRVEEVVQRIDSKLDVVIEEQAEQRGILEEMRRKP